MAPRGQQWPAQEQRREEVGAMEMAVHRPPWRLRGAMASTAVGSGESGTFYAGA